MECQLSNIWQPASARCDCEKRLDQGKTTEFPLTKVHSHLHLDDFFLAKKIAETQISFPAITPSIILAYSKELAGFLPALFQPPRA